jgi:hypothetical protein
MLVQIAIGSVLLIANILLAAVAALGLEVAFVRGHGWLMREPHRPKLVLLVAGVSLWMLGIVTASVWIWAGAYYALGTFATLEESVYFSIVSFTTLGFGDVILPKDWRILAGMEAANGFILFGLLGAMFIEALRHIRLSQVEHSRRRSG